ncbi:MAG: HEPN domain-containing protein [Verrucomicrobiota bacterium]
MTTYDANGIRDKALSNLRAAAICYHHNLYDACINRSYYACAQAAIYGLIQMNVPIPERPNHRNIIDLFAQRYRSLHPGLVPVIRKLYSERQDADYSDRKTSSRAAAIGSQSAADFLNRILLQ